MVGLTRNTSKLQEDSFCEGEAYIIHQFTAWWCPAGHRPLSNVSNLIESYCDCYSS